MADLRWIEDTNGRIEAASLVQKRAQPGCKMMPIVGLMG